jgi:hypothetical protein
MLMGVWMTESQVTLQLYQTHVDHATGVAREHLQCWAVQLVAED